MRHIERIMVALVILILAPSSVLTEQHTYLSTDEIFPNPERGFFHASEAHAWVGADLETAFSPLDVATLQQYRSDESISLVKRYYYLERYKPDYQAGDSSIVDIEQAYLDLLQDDFDAVRTAGLKLIVRFAYANQTMQAPFGDASKVQILHHLGQLQPVLQANEDVIAVFEAGFIGNWGEWLYTDHFDETQPPLGDLTTKDYADRKEVVDTILNILPSRSVQVRAPHYKYQMDNPVQNPDLSTPIDAANAHNSSFQARVGYHNDCFLGNESDAGTFGHLWWVTEQNDRDFMTQESNYVPVGGEACEPGSGVSRFDCSSSLAEMAQYHWSYLNVLTGTNSPIVYDGWEQNGCLDEIRRRLGFRLQLDSATIADTVGVGSTMSLQFQVSNVGWAAPYNARPVRVILRDAVTGQIHPFELPNDPRMWLAGQTQTLNHALPVSVPSGDYDVLLYLPDGDPLLEGRPEYAIRLANEDVWEAATGYNDLGHKVHVKESKILYQSDLAGNFEIFSMNPDGSEVNQLTNDPAHDTSPSLSSTGLIAFDSNRGGHTNIWTMNTDGTGLQQLTQGTGSNADPEWSPDGGKVAFYSMRDGGDFEIYAINSDGSGETRLTNSSGVDAQAAWSPDGTQIAFCSNRNGNYDVFVMNADGSNQVALTSDPHNDGNPAWSPDGSQIAFTSERSGTKQIYLMNANGSGQSQWIDDGDQHDLPIWSPDGGRIVFITLPVGGGYSDRELEVMNIDHTDRIQLTSNSYRDEAFSWGLLPLENLPPVLAAIGDQSLTEGDILEIPLSAADGSDAAPVFSVQPQLSFVSLSDHGNGTATLTLSPVVGDAGSHTVTVTATDGQDSALSDSEVFDITVDVLPVPRIKPKRLLTFFAWPVSINGTWNVDGASAEYGQYDIVVLGGGRRSQPTLITRTPSRSWHTRTPRTPPSSAVSIWASTPRTIRSRKSSSEPTSGRPWEPRGSS